jgi:hypothetical protein
VTLIGTLVSDTVIVQVSDRRISWRYPDGSFRLRDDTTNKSVLYENRAVLSFTGLAELEGVPTDMWIATRLAAEPTLNDGLERLTSDLSAMFQKLPYRGQPHSIVVGGWRRNGPIEPTPFSGLVSNHFRQGNWVAPVATFDWFVEMATPGKPSLVFVPNLMPKGDAHSLFRQLLRVKSRGLNIVNAVRLVVAAIAEVANTDGRIGKELMVSVLPRSAVPRSAEAELLTLNGRVEPYAPSFWSVTASGDFVQYSPVMILNGMVFSNVQIRGGFGSTGISVSRGEAR